MAKQPPRAGEGDQGDQGEREQPQGLTDAAVDAGTGTDAVDTRRLDAPRGEVRAQPTGAGGVPLDAVEVDHSGRPDSLAEAGPVPSENVGEDSGPVLPDPQWQARADAGHEDVAAAAQQAVAAQTGDVRNQIANDRVGPPEARTNADVHALEAELGQQGPSAAVLRVTAAMPEAWVVSRTMGLAVYVPVRLDLTQEQRNAGVPEETFQHVAVPYGSPLPDGTPLTQLENLRLLGWVEPRQGT